MKPRFFLMSMIFLGASLGCAHKTLDTTMAGHHTENLRAEAQRVDQGWRVTLQLPAGEWKVRTPHEEQGIQVVPGTPYSVAQWTVAPDRWAKERPFDLVLEGEGLNIPITVSYRHDLPRWVQFVLVDLAGGGLVSPDKKY